MNNEMAGWVRHFARGFAVDEETVPVDLMVELGAAPLGGNFLGANHTLRLYRETLWQPSKLTNRKARDAWVAAGRSSVSDRAREMIEETLSTYEPSVPERQQSALRDLISEVLDREGIELDEAKRIMEMTYWQG